MRPRTSRARQALALALGCTFAFGATAQVNPTSPAPVIPTQSTPQRPAGEAPSVNFSGTTTATPTPGSVTGSTQSTITTGSGIPATRTSIGTTAATAAAPGAIVITPGITAMDTSTATTVGSATESDRALLDAVVSALSIDPSLRGAKLNVRVSAGAVRVSGTATDAAQAARAQQVAASVAGNARVSADITPVG